MKIDNKLMSLIKEKKFKLLFVDESIIWSAIQFTLEQHPKPAILPSMPVGLPEDAFLVRVFLNAERNAFGFILAHESFKHVKDGALIPVVEY